MLTAPASSVVGGSGAASISTSSSVSWPPPGAPRAGNTPPTAAVPPIPTCVSGSRPPPGTPQAGNTIPVALLPQAPQPHTGGPPHTASWAAASLRKASAFRKPMAFHLFSGPTDREDGIAAIFRLIGWDVIDVDILAPAGTSPFGNDLSQDSTWECIRLACAAGGVDAIIAGPVCSTFSKSRSLPGGPRPVRSPQQPYGLTAARLTSRELVQVKLATTSPSRPPV